MVIKSFNGFYKDRKKIIIYYEILCRKEKVKFKENIYSMNMTTLEKDWLWRYLNYDCTERSIKSFHAMNKKKRKAPLK